MQRVAVLSLGVLLSFAVAQVRGEGWSLWPKSSTSAKTTQKKTTTTAWSSGTTPQNKASSKSSKSWSETLMPWKKTTTKPVSPYNNLGRPISSAKKEPEKKSFFANWFQQEEPKPPRSLGEWMALERSDP